MFTRMQKYHKLFLVFITALLAITFGMGTVCVTLVQKEATREMASFAGQKVTGYQFQENLIYWTKLHELARKISPKAHKMMRKEFPKSQQEYFRLLYMTNPLWDSIFSLCGEVRNVDRQLEQKLAKSRQRTSANLGFQEAWEQLQFYLQIPDKQKQKLRSFPKKDVWNMMMLSHEAENWGIEVTPEEIEWFLGETQTALGGASQFNETLRNLGSFGYTFAKMSWKVLQVLKYLQARACGVQVGVEEIQQEYARAHTEYQLQWTRFDANKWYPQDDEAYLQLRLAFFQEQAKNNPDYFKIPARADYEYILVKNDDMEQQVTVSQVEIDEEYEQKHADEYYYDNEEIAKQKEKIASELRSKKAAEKAKKLLTTIREKLIDVADLPLQTIARHYKMLYQSRTQIERDSFFEEEHVGTVEAGKAIYENLNPGDISPVFDNKERNGFFILKLRNIAAARQIEEKELTDSDELFLKQYYRRNKNKFSQPEHYRLGYVLVDYNMIKQNLLVTTPLMKQFYEDYKQQLYVDNANSSKDILKYQSFDKVRSDIQKRVANFLRSREVQKIYNIHHICKERGENVDIETIVRELAKQIMLAPDSLRYNETPTLMTIDEIRDNNPTGDSDFPGSLSKDTQISDVKDGKYGKYFYKILEYKAFENAEFAQLQKDVHKQFLQDQALERARKIADNFRKNYQTEYDQLRKIWQKKLKLASPKLKTTDGVKPTVTREKRAHWQRVFSGLFKTIAAREKVLCRQTEVFQNIKEVEELEDNLQLATMLKTLNIGNISRPLVEEKQNTVLVVQVLKKKAPSIEKIPLPQRKNIRKLLLERKQSALQEKLLDFQRLSSDMNLQRKEDDAYDNLDEEDLR